MTGGIDSNVGRKIVSGKRLNHGNDPNLREAAESRTKASVPCEES